MPDVISKPSAGRQAGWYVLFLAWIAFAVAFFAFSKLFVTPASDITNSEILGIAQKYGALVGIALGFLSFLAAGIVYVIVRLARVQPMRSVALALTGLAVVPWIVFGYDLVYLEPRYTEVARAIITYAGKPMLYAAILVAVVSELGLVVSIVLNKRK